MSEHGQRAQVATIPIPGPDDEPAGELRVILRLPMTIETLAGVADLVENVQRALPSKLGEPLRLPASTVDGLLELVDAASVLGSFSDPAASGQPHHWIRTELQPALARVLAVVADERDVEVCGKRTDRPHRWVPRQDEARAALDERTTWVCTRCARTRLSAARPPAVDGVVGGEPSP